MAAALAVAVPIGLLCVRYVKIYFGMLTSAFGMLFYSFLLKFYHLTGGDEGMRVRGRSSSARASSRSTRCRSSSGPSTTTRWACWSLPPLLMWRIVRSPFGLCLRAIRENPGKAESSG